jgi:alpha-tubulin suppressor-like RCC1 family protein
VSVRSIFVFAGLSIAASSALVVACADDSDRGGFIAADSGVAPPPSSGSGDASDTPVDGGIDPDARGPFNPADEPVTCAGAVCATDLVAGDDHFCARMNDGTVRCWGADAFGALGGSTASPSEDAGDGGALVIGAVPGLGGVTQISAGGATTCARLADGGVQCWGANQNGELGLAVDPPVSDGDLHSTPAPVALDEAAVRVDVGHGSACALLSSGKLSCWGKDDQRQLARKGDSNSLRGPGIAAVDPLTFARTLAGSFTNFGIDAVGQVFSWGALAGDEGVVSGRVASVSPDATPRRLESLSKVTSFAATQSIQPPWDPPPWEPGEPPPDNTPPKPRAHACAIASGEVHCWGMSYTGALCTGLPDREQEPTHAPIIAKSWPQQLAVGDEITCARMTDGTVQCCGSNNKGRLGAGSDLVLTPFFQPVGKFTGHAVRVAASSGAVCALVQDGTVQCWGSNAKGELARSPDGEAHPSPSAIGF